ncbi:MAG: exopolysaccharide biosynthesis polyprenyl glycosylphosphotransferase [uncultured bacterium]|nr:MAG: exopolysaccharide biosynthesis polyprenyl glycosylphosphotransferase [uncultured bacterium]
MKKRSELLFSAIQVPTDMAAIILAALSAFAIRNIPEILALKPKLYTFPLKSYLGVIMMVVPFIILVYAMEGLYNLKVTRKFWREARSVFTATSIVLVGIIAAIFLKREWFSSRFIILSGWFLATTYVIMGRYLLQKIQKHLLKTKGIGIHKLLLVGNNNKMNRISSVIKSSQELGYKIIGHVDSGSVRVIREIKKQFGVDEIIVCDSTLTDEEQEKMIDFCAINNITYKFIPTTLQTARFEAGIFSGEPIIEIKHTPLEGWGKILKRIFDIVASSILIILLSPIMLITAFAVWLETGFPIIYKNQRIGADGKLFFVLKFRYMRQELCTDPNTPEGKKALEYEKQLIKKLSIKKGPLYKIKNDPRKTKVGAFIEKVSLDELPQLFNVFVGDMSLIGPRPHQEREVEKYSEYHRRLLTIKPGVSGMAQISGRSDLEFEDEYKLDVYYIENWSLWLDIQICLKTVTTLLKKRRN